MATIRFSPCVSWPLHILSAKYVVTSGNCVDCNTIPETSILSLWLLVYIPKPCLVCARQRAVYADGMWFKRGMVADMGLNMSAGWISKCVYLNGSFFFLWTSPYPEHTSTPLSSSVSISSRGAASRWSLEIAFGTSSSERAPC